MQGSVIGNFLIEKAHDQLKDAKKKDSYSDYGNEHKTKPSKKSPKRVSFKNEALTPNVTGFKVFPQFLMGGP